MDRFPPAMVIYVRLNVKKQGGALGSLCYNLMVEAGNAGDWEANEHLALYALSFDASLYWLRRAHKQNNRCVVRQRLGVRRNRPCYHDLRFVEVFALSWSQNVQKTGLYDDILDQWTHIPLPKTHAYLFGKYGIDYPFCNLREAHFHPLLGRVFMGDTYNNCVEFYTQTRRRVQRAVVCFVGILKREGMSKDMRCVLGKVIWSTRETEWF